MATKIYIQSQAHSFIRIVDKNLALLIIKRHVGNQKRKDKQISA
jgi:hypothetical protein